LVVQFKPHYIAAGSLYLAAKFNNFRLPSDGKVWWHEFDVAPKQLQGTILIIWIHEVLAFFPGLNRTIAICFQLVPSIFHRADDLFHLQLLSNK
jgi:hypothetical protein